MRRFTVGDIHGSYKGLKQVLDIVNFDYNKDLLICLGDVCDGWSQTKESIDLLMTVENLVFIKGNHDNWASKYFNNNLKFNELNAWYNHGGDMTVKSLTHEPMQKYINFLNSAKIYYELDEMIFAHASVCLKENLEVMSQTNADFFYWDRTVIEYVFETNKEVDDYKKIFLGHTPTTYFIDGMDKPIIRGNVYFMDTGSAFKGRVTLMDIDTEEYYQSDRCMDLYPQEFGRNKY